MKNNHHKTLIIFLLLAIFASIPTLQVFSQVELNDEQRKIINVLTSEEPQETNSDFGFMWIIAPLIAIGFIAFIFFSKRKTKRKTPPIKKELKKVPKKTYDPATIKEAESKCSLGISQLKQKNYEDAVVCFSQALDINPDATYGVLSKTVELSKHSKHSEIIENFEKSLMWRSDYARSLLYLAISLKKAKKYEEAITCYKKILSKNENNSTVLSDMADVYQNMKKYESALSYYDKSLKYFPKNYVVLNKKGLTLLKLGKQKKAIQCFDMALLLDPQNSKIMANKELALHNP